MVHPVKNAGFCFVLSFVNCLFNVMPTFQYIASVSFVALLFHPEFKHFTKYILFLNPLLFMSHIL